MNSVIEKEKKLNLALTKLKNLNLKNPDIKKNIENLSTQKNQLEIEKQELEEKYKSLVDDYNNLSKKLDEFNLPPISFIKMDIQGSEVNALRGAKETIMRHKPIMFVEIEEQRLRSFKSSSKELIELLLGYGYTLFRVMTDYPCDHICVPKEKVGEFVLSVLEEFSYKVEKIEGEKVNLFFNRAKDQNYERIEIDE